MMKKFYITYKDRIPQSLIAESSKDSNEGKKGLNVPQNNTGNPLFSLSWTHYIKLMSMESREVRNFYEIEAARENWSVRELQRQMDSSLYERLSLSRNKKKIKELSTKGLIYNDPADVVKGPYVLEFLGLKEHSVYTESDLETAIIDKIEQFMLELGKGFLFYARQKRFTFEDKHFYVDLVFYNRLLQCFVIIDLKIGELTHQDLGQIQMYVNYFDRFVKTSEENKTIGIIVCKSKNDSIVEITLPEDNKQIFASKYQLYLPSKAELIEQIDNINDKSAGKKKK